MKDLDAALLEAHAANDRSALVTLYKRAAQTAGSQEATAFYLTHAYVFALEAGNPQAGTMRAELEAMGRI